MENNFFLIAEDTIMKPPPLEVDKLRPDDIPYIYRNGDKVKLKSNSYPALQFILKDVRQYDNLAYENCDLNTDQLFFHCHNLFEVTVILSGRGFYFVNGKAIEVKAGSIIIFNKLVPHAWIAEEGNAPVQRSFSFYPSLMLGKELAEKRNFYINKYLEQLTYWSGSKESEPFIWEMFDQIYWEFQQKDRGYMVFIKGLVINFFIIKSREFYKSYVDSTKQEGQQIEKALIYMRSNFQKGITLEDVSREVYMHPNYFSSIFKKRYGVPYVHYMNMLKATMASELMQSTELPVEEISRQCGFSSASNFYRVFKEFYKISPLQYIKNIER